MILLLHIAIAISSIAWATYGYIRPTDKNIQASYALITMTFMSGFALVWSEPAQILRTCLSGIGYLAVVTAAVMLTRKKLSYIQSIQATQASE